MIFENESLRRAVWLAATVGPFRPRELLDRIATDVRERRSLAAQLATLCSEIAGHGSVLWHLGADARRRAFADMNEAGVARSGQLSSLIHELAPVPEDHFGRHLRDALTGHATPEQRDESDLDAHYAAYEFVGRSDAGLDPAAARESAGILEQHARRLAAEQELEQAAGRVFVDREQEREAILRFARTGEVVDPDYRRAHPDRPQGSPAVPMLYVNGVGGAGKSALIARMVQQLRAPDSGVGATIILDFDRPMLADLDPVDLTIEFMRQLAICVPGIAKDLREIRRTAMGEFSQGELQASNASVTYGLRERASYSINSRLREVIARSSLHLQPVLIVLDTFEEVLTLGAEYVERVHRWLFDLSYQLDLAQLRAVLSGRATPDDLGEGGGMPAHGLGDRVVGSITVGDLPEDFAQTLLHERGVKDPALAADLITRFGANPLVLKLLGDYADQQKNEETLRALLEDEGDQQYRAAVAQRVLYSRILGRIREDEALRALASPGLIVRVVTPGVIRKVLAEPCGLGTISQARAEELFAKLARQVWLVRRQSEVAVTHRRDMRTVMLPLANQPGPGRTREELTSTICDIHRLAVEFHRDPENPELPPEMRRIEALYHELFLDPETALARRELASALPNLAVDIDDFPPGTRARLKQMMGRTLTRQEYQALDRDRQIQHQAQMAQQSLRSTGKAESAFPVAGGSLAETAGAPAELPASEVPPPEAPLVQSPHPALGPVGNAAEAPAPVKPRSVDRTRIIKAFAYGEFEEIAAHARLLLFDFLDRVQKRQAVAIEREMVNHVTWLAALSTLSTPIEGADDWRLELANEVAAVAGKVGKPQSWPRLDDKSQLSLGHYVAALVVLLSQGGKLSTAAEDFIYSQRKMPGSMDAVLSSTTALRIFQMFAVADAEGAFMWRPSSVATDRLQIFAPLLEPDVVKKYDGSMIAARKAWRENNPNLRKLVGELESHLPSGTPVQSTRLADFERDSLHARFDLYHWHHPRAVQAKRTRRLLSLPWAAFRGISPELNPPLVSATRQRFFDVEERSRILRRLRKCSAYWPEDLGFTSIGAEAQVSDTFVSTVVHFADRFAAIPVLFMGASADSLSGRVHRVYAAYSDLVARVTRDARPPRKEQPRLRKSRPNARKGPGRKA